jgi:hypothetical protein
LTQKLRHFNYGINFLKKENMQPEYSDFSSQNMFLISEKMLKIESHVAGSTEFFNSGKEDAPV